jgi:hypothetical protein
MNVRIRYIGTKDKNIALEYIVQTFITKWELRSFESAVKWLVEQHKRFKFIDDIYIDEKNKRVEIRAGKSLYRIEEQKLSHK